MKVELFDLGNETLANCYILTDEKTGISGIADIGWYTDSLDNYIKSKDMKVEYIILTHGHFDHIMGVAKAREATGAKILIHKDDAICLKDKNFNLMNTFGVKAEFEPCEPDIIANDGDIIKIGESELKTMHTPGHSKGSVIFIDNDGHNIISGDTLFHSTVGRTDTLGGSIEEMKVSVKKILALDGDYDIYPGHGPATTLSHERVRNIFIRRMERN